VEDGYEGLVDGRFVDLTPGAIEDHWPRGGTFLGTARSERFRTKEGRSRAARNLVGIDALLVVGGNGSLSGAHALMQEHGVAVVGVPASIDNDLACTTTAIGVDTALNTIVEACDRISDTARSHHRVFLVEVMGRECGYLAMAAAIGAGADAVIFREQGKSEGLLVEEMRLLIKRSFAPDRRKRRVLVIKAEGVEVATARLAERLNEHLRTDSPGVEVRCTVLGHVVRGGNPSFRDRLVAGRFSYAAVGAAMDGALGTMAGWEPIEEGGLASRDPSVKLFPLARVLEETETLIEGNHPTTRRRLKLLEAVEGVLAL
jgi:6-phosphofructokinase 1